MKRRVFHDPDDRRRELMDEAASLFARQGLADTTVADIAAAAKVAKGSFYLAFSSKEELLGALKQRFADEMVERTAEYAGRVGAEDLWALADAMVESIIHHHIEHRDLIDVIAREGVGPDSSPEFAASARKVHTMIAEGIEAGVRAGTFACRDPFMTAGLLMNALHGFMEHCILYDEVVDEARLVAAAKDMVHKVLRP